MNEIVRESHLIKPFCQYVPGCVIYHTQYISYASTKFCVLMLYVRFTRKFPAYITKPQYKTVFQNPIKIPFNLYILHDPCMVLLCYAHSVHYHYQKFRD